MIWNKHFNIKDKHAFLSPSQYHWINYDNEKVIERYNTWKAAQRGTLLHELAATLISTGIKLPKSKKTLNQYVNDCIGFNMRPEQPLYFSENCFGTADAISFKNNEVIIENPEADEILPIMDKIETFDKILGQIKSEEE